MTSPIVITQGKNAFLHTNNCLPAYLFGIGLLMSVSLLNKHNRLASACPLSNLSPVFRPSMKRKIGIREAITQQREKRLPISYLALKIRYINKTHTESGVEKFLFLYVFLFSAKTRIYKQNKHTYSQCGAENSLFQFCLTISEPFSPFQLEEMKNF